MTRKTARQSDPTEEQEDQAPSPEIPAEGESTAGPEVLTSSAPARPEKAVAEDEGPSSARKPREYEPMGGVDEHAQGAADEAQRFSPAGYARFTFRALCYFAGRAADKLVSVYTSAVSFDRDYIADFNKSAGLVHVRHKRWNKAIPLLEKSLEAAPDDVETRIRLAEAYAATTQYDRACKNLEEVLEREPRSAVAVRALGAIYARQQDYDRAIEYLERAAKLDPDQAQTYYRLGMAYDNKKRYEQAVEAFKKAIRLDPRFAKAYQALGFTHESMGNRELAVENFKKALELE